MECNQRSTSYQIETSASYSYDVNNRTTAITNTSSVSGTLSSFQYSVDKVGNRTAVTDLSGTTSYRYDSLYRLTEVTYTNSITNSYSYDAVGNRTRIGDANGGEVHSYDAADRDVGYSWDTSGNLIGKGGVTYKYDSSSRLTSVVSGTVVATFDYNSDGLRTSMTVNGARTSYLWDTNASLPVILSDTNSIYIYGLSLLARQTGEVVEYYHSDALGSVRNLTNGSGQGVGAYNYKPFGGQIFSTANSQNDRLFTGQQFDPSGLYYLRARYYDPDVGRFLTRDPFSGYADQPRSLNLYTYGYNNPTTFTDPTGNGPGEPPPPGIKGPPPVPIPGAPPGKEWDWEWFPNLKNKRQGTWRPAKPINGRIPEANWDDHVDHWDVNDGAGHRQRYDEFGNPLTPEEAHDPNREKPESSSSPCQYQRVDPTNFDNPWDENDRLSAAMGGGIVVYLAYRVVRFLPSLYPPLWPTIPENLAWP